MSTSIEYASFLIRLWRQVGDDRLAPPAGWRSQVEHIQSGKRWDFDSLEDLLNFLRQEVEIVGESGSK